MNAIWPKSPPFLVFCSLITIMPCTILREFATVLIAQLLEQVIFYLTKHFSMTNLKKLGLLTKIWIAFLVVKLSQKSLVILKMLLSLEPFRLWGSWLRFLLNWSREALFHWKFLDKCIILVPIEQDKECLRFKLGLGDKILSWTASRTLLHLSSGSKLRIFTRILHEWQHFYVQ